MTDKKDPRTIEEIFAQLEEIASKMESGEVPLEESFAMYEEGMRLLKEVTGRIDLVEKKILKLSEDGTLSELEEMPAGYAEGAEKG